MKLKLHKIAEEIEHEIAHLYDSQQKIRAIERTLHELLKPLEQHFEYMEHATEEVNRYTSNRWIGRRIAWGIL